MMQWTLITQLLWLEFGTILLGQDIEFLSLRLLAHYAQSLKKDWSAKHIYARTPPLYISLKTLITSGLPLKGRSCGTCTAAAMAGKFPATLETGK